MLRSNRGQSADFISYALQKMKLEIIAFLNAIFETPAACVDDTDQSHWTFAGCHGRVADPRRTIELL